MSVLLCISLTHYCTHSIYTIEAPGQGWQSRESHLAVHAPRGCGPKDRSRDTVTPETTRGRETRGGTWEGANDVATARRCV